MTDPTWPDPDVDDPGEPFPFDVESARRWAAPPPVIMAPPLWAWWCPVCGRLEQQGRYLHDQGRSGAERTPGARCPAQGVAAVRLDARPPVPPGPGLPADVWWCPVCRYLVPGVVSAHPAP
ncbi:hypothetical protein [Streptomyces sp. RKAG293]|uniref:hypothetical protein n=1 Tax=Streptomyces sp. RKAG293 TaxID=2893403 RepID=UPI002033AA9E|nr:hypothetical protein [Streptomyces sp. RKAG293]MCM2416627.1 hypothetical protein [Streptomyces sp. RKAG293]